MAAANNVDILVLGAFGCGAFNNPPELVADVFRQLLIDMSYGKYFKKVIYPYCTPEMIGDFKACGGVLLLATGFRMMKIKEFPIADMIPAMVLVMPLSSLWTAVILPLVS